MLQKVLKVSNAEHKMFYEKEAGADLGTLERGGMGQMIEFDYAMIILKSFKMLKTKGVYLSANFKNII